MTSPKFAVDVKYDQFAGGNGKRLPVEEVTIPVVIMADGYRTCTIGNDNLETVRPTLG